jgi:rhamnose utilization protein RhaD (predicted bifunctional aldolase and dehydrogenase)
MINHQLKLSVINYCTKIGDNHLFVQGAGGNVSWKEENTLWIKASGTWLAEASKKDIFVPVDLIHLQGALHKNNFNVTPKLLTNSLLKPSIETILHALMPQKIVVHLHAIEALAHLVRDNCQENFQSLIGEFITPWTIVDYYKPGAALALAIKSALQKKPLTKLIFLKNHGIVIGGDNIFQVSQILDTLTEALKSKTYDSNQALYTLKETISPIKDYAKINDIYINQLALNSKLFDRLKSHWALFPDHVVFLGSSANTYSNWSDFKNRESFATKMPELVFIKNDGVYANLPFNQAKLLQLRCYYEVASRQRTEDTIECLSEIEIDDLLNWDAEHYRVNLIKQNLTDLKKYDHKQIS